MTKATKPTITTDTELLDLLRSSPTTCGVGSTDDGELYVAEFAPNVAHVTRLVAWIADEGSARALLDRVQDIACDGDHAARETLPLRYGPWCSTWVLPDHPRANYDGDAEKP